MKPQDTPTCSCGGCQGGCKQDTGKECGCTESTGCSGCTPQSIVKGEDEQ